MASAGLYFAQYRRDVGLQSATAIQKRATKGKRNEGNRNGRRSAQRRSAGPASHRTTRAHKLMAAESDQDPLVDALRWYDDESRPTRARRIEWASSLYQSPGMVSGEFVQLTMMEEARVCFVNGQFLATVLCATSAVEHLLVADLEPKVVLAGKTTLGPLIQMAFDIQLFLPSVIQRLQTLNELRNPLAHRRDPFHKSTLVSRYLQHKVHPEALMEKDARFAMEVMYEVFLLLLR